MKTIEEATKENYLTAQLMSDMRLKTIENAFKAGFCSGYDFSNTWYPATDNRQPINTVLLCKVEDYYIIGHFDGELWVNDSDLEVVDVTHYRPIL